MTLSEFTAIIKTYGDQSLPENERWKSILSISVDGIDHPINFHNPFIRHNSYFIDDANIGPGFYIIEKLHSDIDIFQTQKICSFIPLDTVLGISFYSDKSAIDTHKIIEGDVLSTLIIEDNTDKYDYIIEF